MGVGGLGGWGWCTLGKCQGPADFLASRLFRAPCFSECRGGGGGGGGEGWGGVGVVHFGQVPGARRFFWPRGFLGPHVLRNVDPTACFFGDISHMSPGALGPRVLISNMNRFFFVLLC